MLTGTTGDRPEFNLATMIAAGRRAEDRNAFVLQKLHGENGILLTDIGEAGDRFRAAENLGFQPVASRTLLEEPVDQKFHEMHAITRRISTGHAPRSRQQEVIHAADAGNGVSETGGHARTEYRRQHHVGIADDLILALNDVYALGRSFNHFSDPKTASMAARILSMVKGLASTLLAPSWAAFCTSARSPCAVRIMKAAFLVVGFARTACRKPRPSIFGMLKSEMTR
ncbi:hypothetical protein AT6N2_C2005 [Agrobacterium tumefaciens]|nr:hypothetical protein AT6N2_C2005 [Agrobacterium tumefaciens]